MNLEEFPDDVKEDLEDQSLEILETINDKLIIIGGWGVRAHLGAEHRRSTLDVDGVTDEKALQDIKEILSKMALKRGDAEWGCRFYRQYKPRVKVPEESKKAISEVQLRIEISGPRIEEHDAPHYFEFSLSDYDMKHISYHCVTRKVDVKVPPIEHMAAVKLGLPVDYKNNYDAAMLLIRCDIDRVIEVIQDNDDWAEMVLRRMPKLKGRILQAGSIEKTLALAAGLNIKAHIQKLDQIEIALKHEQNGEQNEKETAEN
jgi:hypothetical protein